MTPQQKIMRAAAKSNAIKLTAEEVLRLSQYLASVEPPPVKSK